MRPVPCRNRCRGVACYALSDAAHDLVFNGGIGARHLAETLFRKKTPAFAAPPGGGRSTLRPYTESGDYTESGAHRIRRLQVFEGQRRAIQAVESHHLHDVIEIIVVEVRVEPPAALLDRHSHKC